MIYKINMHKAKVTSDFHPLKLEAVRKFDQEDIVGMYAE